MAAVYRALLASALGAHVALAVAVAALVTIAAWVEGRWPRIETLRAAALPFAAYGGFAWTLGRWRAAGGDVAVAAAGVPPRRAVAGLAVLAGALLWAAGAPTTSAATWQLETSPSALTAHTPRGRVEVTWRSGGAYWAGTPAHPDLPRPPAGPAPHVAAPWQVFGARWAALVGLVVLLSFGSGPPGVALGLGGAVGAFTAAQAMVATLT